MKRWASVLTMAGLAVRIVAMEAMCVADYRLRKEVRPPGKP